MTCKNCGAEINGYSSFCTYCGKPVGSPGVDLNKPMNAAHPEESAPPPGYSDPDIVQAREPFQQPEFGQVPDFNRSSTSWQNSHSGNIPGAAQTAVTRTNGTTWKEIRQANCIYDEYGVRFGIGWLKFIVYVQLFAAGLVMLINAFQMLTGSRYGAYVSVIYEAFGGLKALDVTFGILYLLSAAAFVLTRFMLTGLRRFAPWLYLGLYAANLLIQLIYFGLFNVVTGISASERIDVSYLIDISSIFQLLFRIVMLVVNFIYFKHRMNAFRN